MTARQSAYVIASNSFHREVVIRLAPHAPDQYDIHVLTAEGHPSELSVFGVDGTRASAVLVELPAQLDECPEAADVSVARLESVQALAKAGVIFARGAALAARPLIPNSTRAKKYPAF